MIRNVTALAVVVVFSACQNKQQQPEVKTAPALEKAATQQGSASMVQFALASDKDLICGMHVTAGECDTTLYNDKIYGFCSSDCKTEFNSNPAKYIKP